MAVTHLHRGDLEAWRDEFDRFADLLGDRSLGYYQIQVDQPPRQPGLPRR